MAEYNREEDIQKVLASNPGMTRAEAEAQVDRNLKLNNSLSGAASGLFSKDKFNLDLTAIVKKVNAKSLQNTGDTAKSERQATQGSVLGVKIGETAGGFKSLTVTTDEGETVTAEPSLAMMTSAVDGGGITVTRTSGKKTEITTLTGKVATNGFLTTTVTQGSPKGIEKTLTSTVGASPEAIKIKMRATSSNGDVAEQNYNVNIGEKVTNNVTEVTQKNNDNLANPFGALTSSLSGAAGNPFANILGNVGGLIAGVLKKGQINANTGTVASVASKPALTNVATSQTAVDTTQVQRNFSLNKSLTSFASKALGINLPQPTLPGTASSGVLPTGGFPGSGAIPGVSSRTQLDPSNFKLTTPLPKTEPVEIVKQDGSTNLSKAINKSTLTDPSVKATTPITKLDNPDKINDFNGTTVLPRDYFSFVNSKEELEAEIRNISTKRPITAFMVGATNTPYDRSSPVDVMHNAQVRIYNTTTYLKKLGDRLGNSDTNYLKAFVAEHGGTQTHYYIRRDGSLQRGRPLIKPLWDGSKTAGFNGFTSRLIHIDFEGGLDATFSQYSDKSFNRDLYRSPKNYTTKQWETFEMFCKAFEAAIPGGEGIGLIDTYTEGEPNKPVFAQPFFDVREWTKTRFGWETSYTGNYELNTRIEDKLGALLPTELNNAIPEKIVKPTITPVVTKAVDPPKKPADPDTGEKPKPTPAEEKSCEDKMQSLSEEIDKKVKEKGRISSELSNLQRSDKAQWELQKDDLNLKWKELDAEIKQLEIEYKECEDELTEETPKKEPVKKYESASEERTNRNKIRRELFSLRAKRSKLNSDRIFAQQPGASKVGVLSDSEYNSQLASLESQISAKESELAQAERTLAASEKNQQDQNNR